MAKKLSNVAIEVVTAPVAPIAELSAVEQFTRKLFTVCVKFLLSLKIEGMDTPAKWLDYTLAKRHSGTEVKVKDLILCLANPAVKEDGRKQSVTEILTSLGLSKGGKDCTPSQFIVGQIVAQALAAGIETGTRGRQAKNDPVAQALAKLKNASSAEDLRAKRAAAAQVTDQPEPEIDFSFMS